MSTPIYTSSFDGTGGNVTPDGWVSAALPTSAPVAYDTTTSSVQAPAPAPDPYAAWGGQTQYNAYNNAYQSGITNVGAGANDAFGGLHSSLQGNASNLFNQIRVGQQGIDTSRTNNELNRMNGIADIVGYVRNGVKQGYSRLAQGNAIDSSAAGALGQAYSLVGNSRARGVNNQAAIQGNTLNQNQNELELQKQNGITDFHRTRDQAVNAIGADVRSKLASLDQMAASLSLPGRINIDQEKQRIIDQGNAQLVDVDAWLQSQLGTITPENQDQVIAGANNLKTLGAGTGNPFNVGQLDQQSVTGPAVDQLPLFISRRRQLA